MPFSLPQPVHVEIKAIESGFVDKSRLDVVVMKDRSIELLLAHGGAEADVEMPSRKVFAHTQNRDKEILNANRAHSRMEAVCDSGFSMSVACRDAVCFEDHPIRKPIGKAAEALTAMSETFAKYSASEVTDGSVGSSHFNHSLECALQGVPCGLPSISENGFMNRQKIETRQPGFKTAFSRGLKWTRVRWEVEEMFPMLPSLFQSALTAGGQVQEGETTAC
jgi:hypothetical protein